VARRLGISAGEVHSVVAFLIDGFGYSQWLEYAEKYDFLKRLTANGIVTPITSVFPSTTAAAVTAIHSGLTPQEHGLPEWWVYFEELGRVIVTLPFMWLGGKTQDEMLQSGVDPAILFDREPWYGSLGESGIASFNFIQDKIASSAYSSTVLKGSRVVPFGDLPDLMRRLRELVQEAPSPAYFHAYWGAVDAAAHESGVHSNAYLAELDRLFSTLANDFLDKLPDRVARQTVLLFMADHGQVNVDPRKTVYLNEYPGLADSLRTGRDGTKILPWGSARDVFVATEEGRTNDVLALLSNALGETATVALTEDALKQGLFGRGQMHREFRSRIGDILILPHGNLTLWYERPYHKRFTLKGMHGGLSPDEVIVPLAVARICDIT
jgi:hypothetical protein